MVSLLAGKLTSFEAKLHLAIWTLAPPCWFAFERFFLFGNETNKDTLDKLKGGQEYSSKVWAAMLALMLAFQLGEIVKQGILQASPSLMAAADAGKPASGK